MADSTSLERPTCSLCAAPPAWRCIGCAQVFCRNHLARGSCATCAEWESAAPTRLAAKTMLAPPAMVLVGGLVFGALAPVLGGFAGALLVSMVTSLAAFAAGAGICGSIDRGARALQARERRRQLPSARLLSR